jgi:replication factor A1
VLRWQLQKFSIVRLDEFICNTVQNRRIIIVLNLTAIQACNEQIGNPVRIDDGAPAGGAPAAPGRRARRACRAHLACHPLRPETPDPLRSPPRPPRCLCAV